MPSKAELYTNRNHLANPFQQGLETAVNATRTLSQAAQISNVGVLNPGHPIPVNALNGPHLGQTEGNIRCIYIPFLHNPFLNSILVSLTGLTS